MCTERDKITAVEIKTVLAGYGFHYAHEAQLQEGVALALNKESIEFEREVRLGAHDRIDFMVGRVGIEVKVGHPLSSVIKQVHRYMQHDIDELLLVTNRCRHALVNSIINGKRVEYLFLGWGSF